MIVGKGLLRERNGEKCGSSLRGEGNYNVKDCGYDKGLIVEYDVWFMRVLLCMPHKREKCM